MVKKIIISLSLLALSFSPCFAANIPEVTGDSKPGNLLVTEKILLKPVIVRFGPERMAVLVNRITDKVEYVWSDVHKCYIRPKYATTNPQILYDQYHN